MCTFNNSNNNNNNNNNDYDNDNEGENNTITQKFYRQLSSLAFLIYTSFICTYKTFVVPSENCSFVSFDCSRM